MATHLVLLALAYNVIPELAEWRSRYEYFWLLMAVMGIVGWLAVLVISRYLLRPVPEHQSTRPVLARSAIVGLLAIVGGGLGWALWQSGSLWYWGTNERQFAEALICILTGSGWGIVAGQVFGSRFPG